MTETTCKLCRKIIDSDKSYALEGITYNSRMKRVVVPISICENCYKELKNKMSDRMFVSTRGEK